MGYIVQSIVFDKDKGWDMKTAREWVKKHKEFSKPIKEEETINTIRVRLFPPKKAEQMGFKDYRMKTLASGDVGIMLDIAYNKMKGGANEETIEYEEDDPVMELRRDNFRIARNYRRMRDRLEQLQDLRREFPEIESDDRIQIDENIRYLEETLPQAIEQINVNNAEIQRLERRLEPTGGGIGSSKAKVAVIDAETERRLAREEEVNRAFDELSRLTNIIKPIEEKLYRIKGNLRGRADTDTQAKINKLEAELKPLYEQRNIYGKILEDYQTTGGSLANEDLQALLAKSYSKNPEDYKDFKVDKDLSGQRVQVYHNPTTQQTIVAHRGTSSVPNWIENVAYAVSNDKSGKAFQHSKKIQDQAYQKYGKENITTIGHSKGALHAQEYGKEGKEVITLNKPVNITDALFTRVPKSQTDIRTQYDPVSFLRPFQRGNKAETIKSTTKNPLKEHQTSVLGRLDPRRLFGSAVKKPPIREEHESRNPATTTIQEIQEAQEQEDQLQQNRELVNNILGQEINNITELFRRQTEDRFSLQEGLVPEFLLEEQIRYAEVTHLAQRLREHILAQVTADTNINPQQIANTYRRVFIDNLRTILTNNRAERRAEEPNKFLPINEGSGMSGGESEEEGGAIIDTSSPTDPIYVVLYLLGVMIGVPLTDRTFRYLYNLYQNNRQVIDDAISEATETTGTTESSSDSESVSSSSSEGDIEEGRGMTGGANIIDITTNRITYNIDLSSKQGFYNTALPYYNAVNIRSYRIDGNMYAIRDVVNGVNEEPEWNRYYQETIIPKIIRSMETTNSNDTMSKLKIFNKNMTKWANILREYLDFYNERDGNYPTPPVSDDEEDEVQNPLYQEGAGMTGGVGELPPFDVNIGRAFRDAKRRWAKSPKIYENLENERRVFNDKYGSLMRYMRMVGGQGELNNTLLVYLLQYSNWIKDLKIPETSYPPVSRGAGKKAKKAKKTGKSKK